MAALRAEPGFVRQVSRSARAGLRGEGSIRPAAWLCGTSPAGSNLAAATLLDFQVHPRSSSDEHYVVRFIEPLDSNRPALGYDIGSEPIRRQAAEQARDTGKATLTRKHHPGAGPAGPGRPPSPAGVCRRPAGHECRGAAGRPDRVGSMSHSSSRISWRGSQVRSEGVEVQVFDGTVVSPARPVGRAPGSAQRSRAEPRALSFERIVQLDCGNTVWTLRFQAGPAFSQARWFSAPGYVPAAGLGLCISLLVFGIARSLAGTRQRAQALADEMTAKLRLQHDAMASAKNGIFILDATRDDCPIIYANPAFERMTGYGVDEPLGDDTMHLLRDGAIRTPSARYARGAGGWGRGARGVAGIPPERQPASGWSSGCCPCWTNRDAGPTSWASRRT